MKSAEQWSKEWQEKEGFQGYELLPQIELLKDVQQDAYMAGWSTATRIFKRIQREGVKQCQSNQPTK